MEASELSQFGLARVERAEFGCAQHQGSRHVQKVQCTTSDDWSVVLCHCLCFANQSSPQVGCGYQRARRQVLLDLLPSGQRFRGSQALLKHSKTQRVSEFDAMEAGEIERNGVCLTPRICFRRVGVSNVKGEKNTGVNLDAHQRSCSRPSMTMFGRTLSPRIIRLRVA